MRGLVGQHIRRLCFNHVVIEQRDYTRCCLEIGSQLGA